MSIDHTLKIKWDNTKQAYYLIVDDSHYNRNLVAHGGVLSTLADWAMASTILCQLTDDLTIATVNFNIHFIKSVHAQDKIFAYTDIIKMGKKIITAECSVKNEQDIMICKSMATFALLIKLPK